MKGYKKLNKGFLDRGFFFPLILIFVSLATLVPRDIYAVNETWLALRLEQLSDADRALFVQANELYREAISSPCNSWILARALNALNRTQSRFSAFRDNIFDQVLQKASELRKTLNRINELLPQDASKEKETLKAIVTAAGALPATPVSLMAAGGGLAIQGLEYWNHAREAAEKRGISRDILNRADAIIGDIQRLSKSFNLFSKALKKLDKYMKEISDLMSSYDERCMGEAKRKPSSTKALDESEQWKRVAKHVVDGPTGRPIEKVTVTLIPRGRKTPGRPVPIDRARPRPGDVIVVSAPCHETGKFIVGVDPVPERIALKPKPIRKRIPGGPPKTARERDAVIKALKARLRGEGVTDFDPESVKFHHRDKPYSYTEVTISRYSRSSDCPKTPPRTGSPGRPAPRDRTRIPIEDDVPRHGQAARRFPSDPYFWSVGSWGQPYHDQWALRRIGFEPGPDGDLPWPERGSPVVVAVVDSGVDFSHPELMGAQWVNRDEIPGNGRDDDHNGYVDDVFGWNFIDDNNDVDDDNGHGTLVAGIIASWVDNQTGIAGVNPWARIMAVKVTDHRNSGGSFDLADGIVYAADNGARVINISVGGLRGTKHEGEALRYAIGKGAVVVVASGNLGVNTVNFSPSGLEGAVTVAATDIHDRRVSFSNWGQAVDIAAPGVDVLSLRADSTDLLQFESEQYVPGTAVVGKRMRYYRASGSSFSAPFVSGAASLILSVHPEYTPQQVVRVLLQSCRDIETPGWDQFTGYGLLDVKRALSADPGFFIDARILSVRPVERHGRIYLRAVGTADADRLDKAWLEIGMGENPARWKKVSEDIRRGVRNGIIADVDAAHLQGAREWTLRLITRHRNGMRRESRFLLEVD